MINRSKVISLVAASAFLAVTSASAHVSVGGPVFAGNSYTLLTFGIGHGCEGADTIRLEIELPEEVTSVRGVPHGVFGYPEMVTDDTGVVTKLIWEKAEAAEMDNMFYQVQMRIGVPDMPFTKLHFPAAQYCPGETEGEEHEVLWDTPAEDIPEDSDLHPSPALKILPPRTPGWNKYTVSEEITDLSFFDDAVIVWNGDAAYSPNADIAMMIEEEEDVETISQIDADSTIWVRY